MIHNGSELVKYCKKKHDFHFQFLPNSRSRLIKIEVDNETLRLIHNFVASVKTLVDISRNYSKKYISSSSITEYKEAVNQKIISSAVANFIFDLRNFILHREMPTIGNGIDPITGISNCIYLHTPSLLEWKNWSSLSANYIYAKNEKDKKIYIDEIAKVYLILSEEVTKCLLKSIVNSNFDDLKTLYSEVKTLTVNAEVKGMITDPLIVQFFTEEDGYIFPSVTI
jgi:hypothetical protein